MRQPSYEHLTHHGLLWVTHFFDPAAASGRCPYYRTAEQGLWGSLPSVSSDTDADYWTDLASATLNKDKCDSSFLQVSSRPADDSHGSQISLYTAIDQVCLQHRLSGTSTCALDHKLVP